MIGKLKRGAVGVVAVTALVVPMMITSGGVALAAPRNGGGCTQIQSGTGLVCVNVTAYSPNSIESFGGTFTSGTVVVRPKLVVDLLYADGSLGDRVEQSWNNDRIRESISKEVNESYARPYERVCATLFEASERLNTACVPVPSP
jgi:hypothetical protein